jgi:phosphoribosylanthranilate isomerase
MWIKICGLTSAAGVAQRSMRVWMRSASCSPARLRQLTAQAAAELARPARGRVRCVAVMRHPDATGGG